MTDQQYRITTPGDDRAKLATIEEIKAAVWEMDRDLRALSDRWLESARERDVLIGVYRRENGATCASYSEGVRDAERACAAALRKLLDDDGP